ncbi:ABC transporter ATP-binding protein [Rhodohalobacter sp. SW132]|uniref:ABC transporter ATP-binding protein n=1 Tax=Rhodohalobacter sp. SW132 TaxID=2293433 RepID=UPI000E22487B|nr:ABC transporter ATP-binding protein [Rhodohalobacter sp. SW132]REL38574.1 ABC transporter ATP-binding protein [Rhodohalobacter sp. SW132]
MSLISTIKFYFSVYRRFIGRRVYIVFVLTAAVAIAEGLGITLLLPLIEAADAGGSTDREVSGVTAALTSFLDYVGIGSSMVGILLFIGVVFIGKGVLKFGEGAYMSYLKARLMVEIKGKMFDAYSTMDYGYYIERNTGHFINIINGQIGSFIGSFKTFKSFLSTIIMTVAYLSVAVLLAWRFALMALVVGVIILFLFRWLNEFVKDLSRKAAAEASELNKFLVQSLQGFKYLASTSEMSFLKNGIYGSIKKLSEYQYKKGLASSFTTAIKEPVSVLFLLFVIIIQVAVFDAPVAPIFVALILFHRGMQQVIGVQKEWQATLDNAGSLEMVIDEFNSVRSQQEPVGKIEVPKLSDSISFEDVSYAYNIDDGDVLKNIDLKIPVNQTVAFVGESGAGKSTLIDMLTLMLRPRLGEIYIDGVAGSDVERKSWRSQIGYVSQETVVFDDTVANNINLWKGDYENDPEVRERVCEAAEKAYALDFINELPDGFDTVVGDRGVRLSGGQRQRLFIARELFKMPNLLILDEATSALDSDSESFIQQSIDNLKGSMTVVIIAHRLSTIKNSDKIYVLDEGRVVEYGSYDELTVERNGRFREMVEMQSL